MENSTLTPATPAEPRTVTFGLRVTPAEKALLKRVFPSPDAAVVAAAALADQLEFGFSADYPSRLPTAVQLAMLFEQLLAAKTHRASRR